MKERNFDIVALQEVRWKNNYVRKYDRYTIYQSCGSTHELGTAFMVLGDTRKRVLDWRPVSDRMCVLRIKGRFFNISIINVHSPHNLSTDEDKDAFYEQLEREYDRCPNYDIKIVIGDLNAQVGQEEEFRPIIGKFSAHERSNENGLRLIDYAASRNMAIRSTFFQHKRKHLYTWKSPSNTETQIDHVLIDGRHFSDIHDVRTYRGANVDSDHYLVGVKLRSKLSTVSNDRYRRPPRYNLERLRDPEVAAEYARQLEALLPEEEEDDTPLEDCWQRTKAAVQVAAESALGFVDRGRRNDWFDDECQRLLDEKNAARIQMLQHRTRLNEERYKQKRREQTRIFREKKRTSEEGLREEMEMLYRSQESRKFYQRLNASRNSFAPQADMCRRLDGSLLTDEREVMQRWKQHFDEHLNGAQTVADSEDEASTRRAQNNEAVPEPTMNDVKEAIKQLKNNKSPGKDDLPPELFKFGSGKLVRLMHRMIARIWETDELPDEWKEGVLCPIYKKGDKLNCENFRGITITNAAYKILSQILYRRLSPLANRFVGSYQAGFTDGRSTTDQVFSVRQILQKCREYQVPSHHLFIDFKAAYDTIDRRELWQIMYENGFPAKLIRLIEATMNGVRCSVRVGGTLSDSFECRRGLRQGDGLSCLLFNIVLEGVMRRAGLNARGTILNKSGQFVCFADDMDIIGRKFETVVENYTRLKREAARAGLQVNASKTKYMLAGGTETDRLRLGNSVTIDGDEFEVVQEFVYLGTLVTADNDMSREIRRRIVNGNRAYYGLRKNLRSSKFQPRTKCTMYTTLIRPVVLYAHEAWTLLEEDLRALGVFERRVLRTIFGGVCENGVWRRRMNHELEQLFGKPSIRKEVKAGRMRWAGHVVRMPDDNPVKMVFASNPVGVRRRGAPRARWQDQVKQDVESIGYRGSWTGAATNRSLWNDLVSQILM